MVAKTSSLIGRKVHNIFFQYEPIHVDLCLLICYSMCHDTRSDYGVKLSKVISCCSIVLHLFLIDLINSACSLKSVFI